jgi:hypothetical protein
MSVLLCSSKYLVSFVHIRIFKRLCIVVLRIMEPQIDYKCKNKISIKFLKPS